MRRPAPPAGGVDRSRSPWFVFVLALPGVVASTWYQLPLAWDGASKLLRTLHDREAYIPHERDAGKLLKAPVLWVQSLTEDPLTLRLVYSGVYAAVPLLALGLSWLILRDRRPTLFIWPALGILLATLPGQAFTDNEGLIIAQLAWPFLLGLLTGLDRPWVVVVVAVVGAVSFYFHASTGLVLLAGAGIVVLGALCRKERVGRALALAVPLVALAAWRLSIRDSYEKQQSSVEVFRKTWEGSVAGAPTLALVAAFALGLLVLLAGRGRDGGRTPSTTAGRMGMVALALLPAVWLLPWAASAELWSKALQYRSWALLMTFPFVGLAALDHWWPSSAPASELAGTRRAVAAGAAAAFSLVLVVQSVSWGGLVDDVDAEIGRAATGDCLTLGELDGAAGTATSHWGTSSLAMVLQGRRPEVVVLGDVAECSAYRAGEVPPVVGSGRMLRDEGWVQLPEPG